MSTLNSKFERDPEADGYTYTIPYGEINFSNVINGVRGAVTIEVDGTPISGLTEPEFLTMEWREVKDGTPAAMNGKVPEDAGNYVLHLAIGEQPGLCKSKECDIHFEITKKELSLDVKNIVSGLGTKAGDKIVDFVEAVKEAVKEAAEANGELSAKVMHPVAEVAVAVNVLKDGGATPVTEGSFSNKSDYSYTVTVKLEESLEKNYQFECNEYGEYRLEFGADDILKPEVELEITNPGEPFDKEYVPNKQWTIDEIVGTRVKAAVTVKAKDETGNEDGQGESVKLEGAEAKPVWYTKETITLPGAIDQWPSINEETQFADVDPEDWRIGDKVNVYTAMGEEPVSDVGDYYIVYVYEGVDGQYAKAVSEPIKVTILPITVILKPEASDTLRLSFGMDSDDVGRVLAGVTGKLYLPKDAAKPIEAGEDAKVEIAKDFYGVTYDDKDKVQYYAPVFRLARTETPITDGKPAAEESKELVWADELEPNTDEMQYTYYIAFSGKKAAPNADGRLEMDWDDMEPVFRDITEASTDSANRNYKIVMDDAALLNLANVIKAPMAERVETEIDVEPIVKAFNDQHGYKADKGTGKIESPARMVYNPEESLFAKRGDYKQAALKNKTTGTAITDIEADDMHYELQVFSGTRKDYDKLINTTEPTDKTSDEYKAWQKLKSGLEENGWSNYDYNYDYLDPLTAKNAGIYRLKVTYKDSSLEAKNEQAENYVYFLIEKQELVLVPDTQYAEYSETADVGTQSLKWNGFVVKQAVKNDITNLSDDLGWDAKGDWAAMTLPLDDLGESPKDPKPEDWIKMEDSDHFKEDIKEDGTNRYIYKTAVSLSSTGPIVDKNTKEAIEDSEGNALSWANYTTENQNDWDADNEQYRQHQQTYGEILFGRTEIKLTVSGIELSGEREYSNSPIYDKAPDVKADATGITVSEVSETEPQDPASVVRIGWRWTDNKGNVSVNKVVPTADAKFGGTYTLVASYKGNGTYKAIAGTTDEWQDVTDKDGKKYEFTVTPRKVVITPKLKDKVTAGDLLPTMLDDSQDIQPPLNVAPGDEKLFEKGSGSITSVIDGKTSYYEDSYPILTFADSKKNAPSKAGFVRQFYMDGNPTYYDRTNKLIRFGKNYGVALKAPDKGFFKEYALSYEISTGDMATLKKEQIERGDAAVGYVDFYKEVDEDNNFQPKGVDVNTEIYDKTEATPKTYEIKPREGIPFIYDKKEIHKLQNVFGSTIESDVDGRKIPLNQNYIAVNIYSPAEFNIDLCDDKTGVTYGKDNFLYKTSIKNAGGYVISEQPKYENSDDEHANSYWQYVITALFPVQTDENGKPISPDPFKITWEKGYEETFKLNLDNAKLEADLTKAVAPKSLAFKNVVKKMAVGEEQQLDVKIAKAQLGDVVRINYRLKTEEDEKYASIDKETGRITALSVKIENGKRKPVTVNVEAYPVYFNAKSGEFDEIEGKLKPAPAKITITDVSAPAIKKVNPKDTTAEVQYTKVSDGYRREIYVKELTRETARDWKNKDAFETAINDQMKNGQWKGIFAIEPRYLYNGTEHYDKKLKLCKEEIGGYNSYSDYDYEFELKPNTMYAVYVRNVSAVRTLADGTKVSESANGSVKTFNTTGTKVEDLELYFDLEDSRNKVTHVDENDPFFAGLNEEYLKKNLKKYYTVNLLDKTAQLSVNGFFSAKLFDNTVDASDKGKSFKLPLKSNQEYKALGQKALLTDPKLSYYIVDGIAEDKAVYELLFDAKGKLKNPSKYATISKNGKISLKGAGENGEEFVTIFACPDIIFTGTYGNRSTWSTTNGVVGRCYLRICANPDDITTKKVKPIKVGDGIRLADYLEYKQGGKKVPNYWSSDIVITNEANLKDAGFEIHRISIDDAIKDKEGELVYPLEYGYRSVDGILREGEYIITAEKPNITAIPLEFTDGSLAEAGDKRFTLSISSAKMDPVKGLKAVYTDDKHITLNFAYAGHPEAFDIEVSDARDNVVYKKLAFRKDAVENIIKTDDLVERSYLQNMQKSILDNFTYFEKTKVFAYTISSEKLMRLSTYKVTVDPIYNGESASAITKKKPASTKAKTTNIPASYENADIKDPDNDWYADFIADAYHRGNDEIAKTYFISGNTYTLVADGANKTAKARGTDTLTWKSSNTKVVSLKANQGSYSATLKAMQQGRATITVTSKVTKKTIARWHVAVKAVGDGKNYGGDLEYTAGEHTPFYDAFIVTYDPYYEGKVEVLTVSNPVNVEAEDLMNYPGAGVDGEQDVYANRTWVQFTAPGYGEYTFGIDGDYNEFKYYYNDKSGAKTAVDGMKLKLEEGQKIYFKVDGTFTLSVDKYTDFSKLTVDKSLTATKDTWVSFTANKDNFYMFTDSKHDVSGYKFEQNGDNKIEFISGGRGVGLEAGQTIFILIPKKHTLSVTQRDLDSYKLVLNAAEKEIDVPKGEDGEDVYAYATFTPDKAGMYHFEYTYPDRSGDVSFHTILGLNDKHNDKTAGMFIEGGETVVVQFHVTNQAFIPDKTSVPVTVKVTGEAAEKLDTTAKLVATNSSKTFEFPIEDVKTATKYTLKVEKNLKDNKNDVYVQDPTVTWTDAQGRTLIDDDFDKSFVVEDGEITGISPASGNEEHNLKPGDKIYVTVNVTVTDDADAAKLAGFDVSLAETPVKDAPGMEAKITADGKENSTEEWWYTFTVEKPGYYEFVRTVTTADGKENHNINVGRYENAFDSYNVGSNHFATNGSNVFEITKPCKLIYKVEATRNTGTTGTTDVTLSIKEFNAAPLTAGSNQVEGLKKQGDTAYYCFEKGTNTNYVIWWVPKKADPAKDVRATLKFGSTPLTDDGEIVESVGPVWDYDKCYIKVTQDGSDPVEGELKVTAEAQVSPKVLTSAATEKFEIKHAPDTLTYTFITPAKSTLGYTVIVENTTTEDETKTMPKFNVNINGYEGYIGYLGKEKASRNMVSWTGQHERKTITISLANRPLDEGVVATGTIAVQPVTSSAFTADQAVQKASSTVKQGTSDWFGPYEITEAARYSFSATVPEAQKANSEKAVTTWYKKSYGSTAPDSIGSGDLPAEYIEKGDEIYVNIKAQEGIPADGLNVTASFTKLQTGTLALGADGVTGEATLTKDSHEYYTFEAPERAAYTIGGYSGTIKKYVPDENGSESWYSGDSLNKGQVILIPVSLPTEGERKLTVTKEALTKLTLDIESKPVTLKNNEQATFEFTPYTAGYYDFVTSVPDKLSVYVSGGFFNGGIGSGYAMVNAEKPNGNPRMITVRNTDPEDVSFTIKAQKVEPVTVELDREANVNANKGRLNVLKFVVPDDYWYTVTCGTGSEAVDLNGTAVETVNFWNESTVSGSDTTPTPKTFYLKYTGDAASQTVPVKISKLTREIKTGDKIPLSLKTDESEWYAYKPAKAGVYTFAAPNANVNLELFRSLANSTCNNQSYESLNVQLGADSEIYIRVTNEGTELKADTDSITVTLDKAAAELTDAGFTSPDRGETYLTFKAPKDGLYTFEVTDGYLGYYGKSNWQSQIAYTSSLLRQFIKGGDVVYLGIDDYNASNPEEGSENKPTRTKVSVKQTGEAQFLDSVNVKKGKYQWIAYTAPSKGEYTFKAANDTKQPYNKSQQAWFCKDMEAVGDNATVDKLGTASSGIWSVGSGSSDFTMKISMEKGETIYIAAGSNGLSSSASYDVYVTY